MMVKIIGVNDREILIYGYTHMGILIPNKTNLLSNVLETPSERQKGRNDGKNLLVMCI